MFPTEYGEDKPLSKKLVAAECKEGGHEGGSDQALSTQLVHIFRNL